MGDIPTSDFNDALNALFSIRIEADRGEPWACDSQTFVGDYGDVIEEALRLASTHEARIREDAVAIVALKKTIRSYIATVLSGQQRNTPEWMEYIAERTNEVADVLGDTDRAVVNRYGNLTIERARGETK